MSLSRTLLLSLLATALFACRGMSQEPGATGSTNAPYPGAVELVADREYQRFLAAALTGMPMEAALPTEFQVTLNAYMTSSPVDSVVAHLGVGAVETYRETVVDPDSMVPAFLGSLAGDALDDLAHAVGSEVAGVVFRDSFLVSLEAEQPETVDYAFVAHENEDGSVTYYEIQRPYFDVGELRWRDATRIRVMRFPFNPMGGN